VYSKILILQYFDGDSERDQYLIWRVGLVFLCFGRPPKDGTLVPKHVAVWYSSWILYYDLYFNGCICWL